MKIHVVLGKVREQQGFVIYLDKVIDYANFKTVKMTVFVRSSVEDNYHKLTIVTISLNVAVKMTAGCRSSVKSA